MNLNSINFKEKFEKFSDTWSPRVIAEMNNYQFKLVKIQGDFVWHQHDDTDETFIVLEGEMKIDTADGPITLEKGEMYVIPKGVKHKPYAESECQIMVIEPKGVVNTGEAGGDLTAQNDVWI